MKLTHLQESLREGRYTSIGSYPKFMVAGDGGCLCWDCVISNLQQIGETLTDKDVHNGYYPLGFDVNWENPTLYCDGCSERIESAYAEDRAVDLKVA